MACTDTIRLGDYGTAIRATITDQYGTVIDISAATTKQIIFRLPDRSLLPKAASFYTDGTDGKLYYTLASGDINQVGRWEFEAYIVNPSGEWHSSSDDFIVKHSLVS